MDYERYGNYSSGQGDKFNVIIKPQDLWTIQLTIILFVGQYPLILSK